jgi:hypothetical protein
VPLYYNKNTVITKGWINKKLGGIWDFTHLYVKWLSVPIDEQASMPTGIAA